MKNYYEILEVSKNASDEIIKKAYITLAKKYHPDMQSTEEGKKQAESKMIQINEAYEVLKDKEKRAEYDEKLEQEENNKKTIKNYSGTYTYTGNNSNQGTNYYGYKNNDKNWQAQNNVNQNAKKNPDSNWNNLNQNVPNWEQILAGMSEKERKKLFKKIERNANEDYRIQAEKYYRSLGYNVKHTPTRQEIKNRIIAVLVIIGFFLILWILPFSRRGLISVYQNNFAIKLFVDLVVNFVKAIFGVFKSPKV